MYPAAWQATRRAAWAKLVAAETHSNLWRRPCRIVEFGVYTGSGMREWLRLATAAGMRNCTLVGFDSFEGLPEERPELKYRADRHNPGWNAGGINTADELGLYDWNALRSRLISNIADGKRDVDVRLVRGFYNESLVMHGLDTRHLLVEPFLIDLDCDLYVSTMQALRFLLETRLLRVGGAYVYLDDTNTAQWQARNRPGEAKALTLAVTRMTAEYGIKWAEVAPLGGRDWRPLLRMQACAKCPIESKRARSRFAPGPLSVLSEAFWKYVG